MDHQKPEEVIQAQQRHRVTSSAFGAKFSNKPEVYRLLAQDEQFYVPPIDCVTVNHLKDMASGKNRRIKNSQMKKLYIPMFDGLELREILEFCRLEFP